MARYRVFVTDTLWPDLEIEKNILCKIDAEIVLAHGKNADEICAAASEYDAILVNKTLLTRERIQSLKKCRVIVRYGIGIDEVDVDAATDAGIVVCNVPDYCQSESADHTMALALGISRKMHILCNQTKAGCWDVSVADNVPRNYGKVFAILGLGSVGRMVAERAQAFGMRVTAEDPYLPDSIFVSNDIVRCSSVKELFSNADFISLHLPLTARTRNIINAETLSYMKPSAFLINISRGGLVNEEDLYNALINKKLAGAALDVMQKEPPDRVNRLVALPNVIVTPHAAWNSVEALPELREKAAEEILLFLTGETPNYVVNKSLLG